MNTRVQMPSLRQIFIWLILITVVSFAIGGIITYFDGGAYKSGDTNTITNISYPRGTSERAFITLGMETGSINLTGGTGDYLLSGTTADENSQKGPNQSHFADDKADYLSIQQEPSFILDPNFREDRWNLSLGSEIPTALRITNGAGTISVRSGHVNLTDVAITLGTGDITLNLSEWSGSHLPVEVEGGLGSITIILPAETSIAAIIDAGIGSRSIYGLEGENGKYIKTIQDHQAPVISLTVSQGVGDLTMRVVS